MIPLNILKSLFDPSTSVGVIVREIMPAHTTPCIKTNSKGNSLISRINLG